MAAACSPAVYVIGFLNFVKIGMSTDVTQRLASLHHSLPTRIKVHQIFEGEGRSREKVLHMRFSKYRTRGEWFSLEGDLADWISEGCP